MGYYYLPRTAMSRLLLAAVFALLMSALVACSGSRKPEPTVATDERSGVQSRLDAMMRVASPCTGAVLVSNAGKVIYKGLVGPPDATSRVGVTTGSQFLIGSLTKQFTAVLVLQQVERGKLNLEDAVTKYLTEYPATGHAVTLHHLLSHTSGVPSYTDLPSFRLDGQQLYTPEEIVAQFRDLPLSFTPGSGSEYSNSGYALLGLILERVTGKTYRELLQENILKPAGMNQTGYDVQAFESGKMAPGHNRSADQNTLTPVTAGYAGPISHSYAAGGIYSTVEDMFLFDRALADNRLLEPATVTQMYTQVQSGYGYGSAITALGNKTVAFHLGGHLGFSSVFVRIPEDNRAIVILCNVGNGEPGRLAFQIATDL